MISVQVKQDRLYPNKIRAGTVGTYRERVQFSFSEEWCGLHCKAVFYPVRGKPIEVLYFGKEIRIPPEVTRFSGTAKYILSGYTVNNGVIDEKIVTLPGLIDVDATLNDNGSASEPDTPGYYEQLRENMKEDIGEAIQEAIDSGDFHGPQGEAATIRIGGVMTAEPDAGAMVVNAGTENDAILNFIIPRGENGNSGVMILEEGQTLDDVPDDINVVINPNTGKIEILDGKNFKILGYMDTVDGLPADPEQGDAYGVGTEAPYTVYVYDEEKGWVDNGALLAIKGEDGRGIQSISRTGGNGTPGTEDTYTVTYTDGTVFVFSVYNGRDGDNLDVSQTVTEGDTSPVSGGGVFTYVTEIMGDFEAAAQQMEALIGGTTA